MENPTENLAAEFFEYLSEIFPVMCASDEFHFLPRAESANRRYFQLENPDSGAIAQTVTDLKRFRRFFRTLKKDETDLSKTIDLEMLIGCIHGILIEIETKECFRSNPLIYLKIAFIGIDHALIKPADSDEERFQRVVSRLHAIPNLLVQAKRNLSEIPEDFHRAALLMASDSKMYLESLANRHFPVYDREIKNGIKKTAEALDRYQDFIKHKASQPAPHQETDTLVQTLKNHFLSLREPSEIFELATREWNDTINALQNIEKKTGKSWRELYDSHRTEEAANIDTIDLYRLEIDRLRHFFESTGFSSLLPQSELELALTPVYLRSVRSSASFSAAFSDDRREKYHFFITPGTERKNHGQNLSLRLHREYRFLTAHETIPGHFLLDSVRRNLKNPVRRQIESPLFYEGWAYHAEQLLIEYGYVNSLLDRVVDYKRRLWRTARCLIDVGISTNRLNTQKAIELLTTCGFSREEASDQIKRFALNPGYQLCYSLGRHEILQLKERHAPRIGNQRFYEELLLGGQIPFHLADKLLFNRYSDRDHNANFTK